MEFDTESVTAEWSRRDSAGETLTAKFNSTLATAQGSESGALGPALQALQSELRRWSSTASQFSRASTGLVDGLDSAIKEYEKTDQVNASFFTSIQ